MRRVTRVTSGAAAAGTTTTSTRIPTTRRAIPSTHGEGGDCSGLTFKTWRESTDDWRDGRYYWRALRNVHGPYTAGDFKNGVGAPNHVVAKATAGVMDAFASSAHIGMVFARSLYGRRPDRRGEMRGLRDEHLLPHVSQRPELRRSGQVGLDRLSLVVASARGRRPRRVRQRRELEPSAPVALRRARPGVQQPCPGSVIAIGRVLDAARRLAGRFTSCSPGGAGVRTTPWSWSGSASSARASRSQTTQARRSTRVTAAPTPPASAVRPGAAARRDGSCTASCSTRGSTSSVATAKGRPLAYAWVEPVRRCALDRRRPGQLHGGLRGARRAPGPGRDAPAESSSGRSRASFAVTQYDATGKALVKGPLEAAGRRLNSGATLGP